MATELVERLGHGLRMWEHGLAFRWIALFMFLGFLVLLAIGVALLWRRTSGQEARPDEALNTVRMRYARGEMTREEFLAANEDLSGRPPTPPVPPAPPPS
ncbi:MAG TPA: hypothetical protein VIC07_07715 [Acidimicrobiia bacterium]|jgi:uncharacterized membrane protein